MSEPQPFDFRAFHARFEIAIIVACSSNGVIGRDGDLPWHLPDDLRHFMQSTRGCPVVMGRKTYDTLDKPLPDRLNIVVSRSMTDPGLPGVEVSRGLDAAIEAAKRSICEDGQDRPIWIAGGGMIYKQALERAQLVVRTMVHCEAAGDTFFPAMEGDRWFLSHQEHHEADERHDFLFEIEWWSRVSEHRRSS